MAEALVRFTDAIQDESGASYEAEASGAVNARGLWEGWIEFVAKDGTAFRSPRETEQPNRIALLYWAAGLTVAYLEGALRRALDALAPPPDRPPAPASSRFPGPAPDIGPHPSHAVLDPFATYDQGEGVLRQQLAALSRDHLLAIIDSYGLPASIDTSADERSLVNEIVQAVAQREHGPTSEI
jgi:hypothetical protein